MNPTTLSALTAFPDQLEAYFRSVPTELRHWTPPSWEGIPSEHLTAIEQVCHVRDIEVEGYHVRFRRTLEEDHPTLAQVDTDAFARDRDYASQDVEAALTEFRAARSRSIDLIAALTPEQFARRATFDGYGPLTLRSLVHFLCSHDQQHLAGLQWLMGKMSAEQLTVDG